MNRLQFEIMSTFTRYFVVLTLLVLTCFNAFVHRAAAQTNQVVQVKAFSENLSPYPDLTLSINKGNYVELNDKGVVFVNLAASDIPIQSIKLKDESLEAASWNLSKGILEVIIRKKSYIDKKITVVNKNGVGIANVQVEFSGNKNISKQTDSEGIINIPLGLNESIQGIDQFKIPGYKITDLKIQANTLITVERIEPKEKEIISQTITVQSTQNEKKDQTGLLLQKLDTINSLRAFYDILNKVNKDEISEEDQFQFDQKFEELLNKLQSEKLSDSDELLGQISDSTVVEKDIDKIFQQVKKDNASMSKKRLVLEEKIQLVIDKLNVGFEQMTEESKVSLLTEIEELEVILENNKSEFNESLNSYLTVINELKRRFFDLQELENKLSESERERLKEKRIYQQRLILTIAIALVFALLIILLFYFRSKLKKQQKELIEANKVVKLTNENLENIVMERTYLLNKTFNELDTVLYKASHDLRAPLSSIAGISDLISRETKNKELTGLLVKTNKRMDKLLKKLSTISEIHQPGDFEEIDVAAICDDCISSFNSIIVDRKIEFKANIKVENKLLTISKLVEVIIYHLLENAFFFCWINNIKIGSVELDVVEKDDKIEISITDNGIGIEKNIQHKIFEMFYVGSELSNGNGLGLYIVQKSVDLLNGVITVSSEETGKTIFRVELPIDGQGSNTLEFLSSLKA
ncbi:sensor histidine kinase [Marivirga harenae]|uniref:sensor histidine kinase n=1 Tax=Marivirga harenae TaxID=2010992 RepID=UPI0026E097D2|nr:HAMP domain-containing sensor histidine kinase [Marivirga harenae]WKV11394.1 HAMP domain-containing sensor histidine kinase [Marivirga harenae]